MEKLAIVGEVFPVPDDGWWAGGCAACAYACPLLPLPLHRLARCGIGDEGMDKSPERSCMVSSSISIDMFCGTFGNTDDDVLARRRRGHGATTVTGTGESPRAGDAARDD